MLYWSSFFSFHSMRLVTACVLSQHAVDRTVESQHSGSLFTEWVTHELTNAGFNILSYHVEEVNLSRTIRGLRIDFIIVDDVQKPQCVFCSKVPGNGSMKPLNFLSSLHSISHIRTWQPHVFADQLRSISYIAVCFWRHFRIGSILSRWSCNSKRNRIQMGSDSSNRTLWIWLKREQKRTWELIY